MKNEISELLSNVSKKEFEKFGDFIRSPYFNKLPRLIRLYEYINDNFILIEKGGVTREKISAAMYPAENFKNESIRKLLSDFWKLLERFLGQEEFENNEWEKKIYKLRGLRKKHLDDKFFKRLKEFQEQHKNSTQEIDEYYETNTKLISEEYEYWFNTKFGEKNEINQLKSDAIDSEFIAKKLFLFQYMQSREYVNKELRFKYEFQKEIEDYVEKNKSRTIKENSEIYRNYLSHHYFSKNFNEKILSEIKNIIDIKKYYLKKISKPYYDYINLCAYQTNAGNLSYNSEIIYYFMLMDKYKIVSTDNEMPHYFFKIAIDAGIYTNEFNWLENFILKYGKIIKYDFKSDMINFSYAKLFLGKNDFSKSKEFASKINYKDYIHYIGAKKILARIAYEEDDFDKIISISEAVKKFFNLHSNIPEIYKSSSYKYFEKITELLKLNEKFLLGERIDFNISKFKKSLENDKEDISFKDWLKVKINKLK